MKTETISISDFKARCLGLIESVAREGRSLLITKHGRPIARVTAAQRPEGLTASWLGTVHIQGDIVHFDASDEWETSR